MDIGSFEAVISWAAFHDLDELLLQCLTDAEKKLPEIHQSDKITFAAFLKKSWQLVTTFEQVGYADEEEDEEVVELNDHEPAIIASIRETLRNIDSDIAECAGTIPTETLARLFRYSVIHEVLRYISREVCNGQVPRTAKDFTVNVKTFDCSTLKDAIMNVFDSRKNAFYGDDDETFELDVKQFCLDIFIESKGKKKCWLLHGPTIIERFDKYSLSQYATELREILKTLKSLLFNGEPVLRIVEPSHPVQEEVENLIVEDNWQDAQRSLVYSAEKVKKTQTPGSMRKVQPEEPSNRRLSASSTVAVASQVSASPLKVPSSTPGKSLAAVMHELHSKSQHLMEEGKKKDPLRFIEEAAGGTSSAAHKPASIPATVPSAAALPCETSNKKRLTDSRPSSSKQLPVSPIGDLDESEEHPAKRMKETEEEESSDDSDVEALVVPAPVSALQRLKEVTEELAKRSASQNFPDQLGSPSTRKAAKKSSKADGGKRVKWTAEEEDALLRGLRQHGIGNWATILEDPSFSYILRHRTNVNLKDKFRNMVKAGIISEGGSTANEA